jgi:hypothetical protein
MTLNTEGAAMPTSKKTQKETAKKTTSASAAKTEKPVENLYGLLGEAERTIRELTVLLAEEETSRHIGVSGMERLTVRQLEIKKQLEAAQRRYDDLLNMLKGA